MDNGSVCPGQLDASVDGDVAEGGGREGTSQSHHGTKDSGGCELRHKLTLLGYLVSG